MGSGLWAKSPVGSPVETLHLHAHTFQQSGYHNTPHGVHGIDRHPKAPFPDSLRIHQRQSQYPVNMLVAERGALYHAAERIDIRIGEIRRIREPQHLAPVGIAEELAPRVEQLESVPLPGIVARGDDDAAVGRLGRYGHLHSRCRAESEVYHIHPHPIRVPPQGCKPSRRKTGIASHSDTGRLPETCRNSHREYPTVNRTISEGVRLSPASPPTVPLIPEIDFIRVMIRFFLFDFHNSTKITIFSSTKK